MTQTVSFTPITARTLSGVVAIMNDWAGERPIMLWTGPNSWNRTYAFSAVAFRRESPHRTAMLITAYERRGNIPGIFGSEGQSSWVVFDGRSPIEYRITADYLEIRWVAPGVSGPMSQCFVLRPMQACRLPAELGERPDQLDANSVEAVVAHMTAVLGNSPLNVVIEDVRNGPTARYRVKLAPVQSLGRDALISAFWTAAGPELRLLVSTEGMVRPGQLVPDNPVLIHWAKDGPMQICWDTNRVQIQGHNEDGVPTTVTYRRW